MPLYEYECDACGQRFEVIQKFSDPAPEACRKCGKGPVHRLASSPAIQFKGTGWYVTDYAQKGKSDSSTIPPGKTSDGGKSDGAPSSSSDGGSKSDSAKSEGKSESKSEGKGDSAKSDSAKSDSGTSGSAKSDTASSSKPSTGGGPKFSKD